MFSANPSHTFWFPYLLITSPALDFLTPVLGSCIRLYCFLSLSIPCCPSRAHPSDIYSFACSHSYLTKRHACLWIRLYLYHPCNWTKTPKCISWMPCFLLVHCHSQWLPSSIPWKSHLCLPQNKSTTAAEIHIKQACSGCSATGLWSNQAEVSGSGSVLREQTTLDMVLAGLCHSGDTWCAR